MTLLQYIRDRGLKISITELSDITTVSREVLRLWMQTRPIVLNLLIDAVKVRVNNNNGYDVIVTDGGFYIKDKKG